jgi:hypothetical protein
MQNGVIEYDWEALNHKWHQDGSSTEHHAKLWS